MDDSRHGTSEKQTEFISNPKLEALVDLFKKENEIEEG